MCWSISHNLSSAAVVIGAVLSSGHKKNSFSHTKLFHRTLVKPPYFHDGYTEYEFRIISDIFHLDNSSLDVFILPVL